MSTSLHSFLAARDSLCPLFGNEANHLSAKTGELLVSNMELQLHSLEIESLRGAKHLFEGMSDLSSAEHNRENNNLKDCVSPATCLQRVLGSTDEVTLVIPTNFSSKIRFETVSQFIQMKEHIFNNPNLTLYFKQGIDIWFDEIMMLTFEPGGSSLFHMGCYPSESNGEKQDFDKFPNRNIVYGLAIVKVLNMMRNHPYGPCFFQSIQLGKML